MDKLGKSVDTNEKSTLGLVKVPSLKVICWKLTKIQLLNVAKFYRCLYGGGGGGGPKINPHQTNVCKFLQLCWATSSLAWDVSL